MEGIREQIDSLAPGSEAGSTRRGFMKTALGVGFVAAASPVLGQNVIKTDSAGLTAGEVTIKVGNDNVPVYRAQPEGKVNLPVILVISEIFGVHEHIADIARRFAKLGYLALAPELFVRQGDPGSFGTIAEVMREVVSKVPDRQIMGDLDAVLAWAGANGGDTGRAGITGFCWGGRITWLYCAHNPKMKAGVAWYGRLKDQKSANNPHSALDIAPSLSVPVLGLYGGRDAGIPLADVDEMKKQLARGKSGSQFVVYPDAPHAFHADYRTSYVEADAKDGWKRAIDWFRGHGVA